MTKEHNWNTTVDGVSHAILCQVMNNKYVLWVDDKFEKTVYRKNFQAARGGLDETLELWGKTCHFVVWPSEKVEFFVDGKSLNTQEDYEHALDMSYDEAISRYERTMRRYSWGMVLIMGLTCILYLAVVLQGGDMSRWNGTMVVVLVILVLNLVGIVRGRKR